MRPPLFALALILAWPLAAAANQPDPFQPMNLLLRAERVREVQAALPRDAFLRAARDRLLQRATSLLSHAPDPIRGELKVPGFYGPQRDEQRRITRRLRGDAHAAHTLALAAAFGAGPAEGDHAKAILMAWVDALTLPRDGPAMFLLPRGDTPIVISYSFPHFLYAFDLLDGLGRLSAGEAARFRAWLRPFVDYMRRPEPIRNNHHDWRMLFLACAAHVLRDPALFAEAVRGYQGALPSQVSRDGSMWRELVRGEKAATYSVMALEAKLQLVEIARHHGYPDLHEELARYRRAGPPKRPRRWGSYQPLRAALDRVLDFVDDPDSWRCYLLWTRSRDLKGPAQPADWGWLCELPARWWGDPRHLRARGAQPYGAHPPRAYTLIFPGLLFRPPAP